MSNHNEHSEIGHVTPIPVLFGVAAVLMVLTWLTVRVVDFDFGRLNLWIAMIIAVVKGSLVALYFMHLRFEKPLLSMIFLGTLGFAVLFIGFAMTDSAFYDPNLIPDYAPGIEARQ